MMEELKILLLALSIGFSNPVPASLKCTKAYYPDTIKGGLQTTQKQQSPKNAVGVEEGNFEYNLQNLIKKRRIVEKEQKHFDKKAILRRACFLGATLNNPPDYFQTICLPFPKTGNESTTC